MPETDSDYMPAVFDSYKTFRNAIRSYGLEDSLAVVRAYSQYFANRVPIPSDMTVFPQFEDVAIGIHQWELEIIARESIAHAPRCLITGKTMRDHRNFTNVLNKLRKLEDDISGLVTNQGNVLNELHRIGHRQFQWQTNTPNSSLMLRYYKIFGSTQMSPILIDKIGLDIKTIYVIGLSLAGTYLKWFALHYPPTITLTSRYGTTNEQLDIFLSHFSTTIEKANTELNNQIRANMNERYAYFFDHLKQFPIIRMKAQGRDSLVSPMPTLMLWRFTQGIYYELFSHRGFSDAFGSSFQNYIGMVLNDLLSDQMNILPEEPTANNRGVSSSDWFLVDDESALYVEVKAKRMDLAAKISLNDTTKLDSELGKLADGLLQTYKCIDAVNNGQLNEREYEILSGKRPYPLVVTLESWHIFGPTWQKLYDQVKSRLVANGLPEDMLDRVPFTVCDVNEFEDLIRAFNASGSIQQIFKEKDDDPELRRYELYTYLFNHHKEDMRSGKELFEGEFDALFS